MKISVLQCSVLVVILLMKYYKDSKLTKHFTNPAYGINFVLVPG